MCVRASITFVHVGASVVHARCASESHSCVPAHICPHRVFPPVHVSMCASTACMCTHVLLSCVHTCMPLCVRVPALCMLPCVHVLVCTSMCACLLHVYASPPWCVHPSRVLPSHMHLMCVHAICVFASALCACLHVHVCATIMHVCAYMCTYL